MKILYTSEALTNQAITASKRINKVEQEKIRHGLLETKEGRMALKGILKRFSGNAKGFINANNSEYKGANLLLEGVIFGWIRGSV
ncbi:D-3-phosphoglycerate dehydrogenase [hydrothermal vent metagenome]|uniref:D-3-phosphoglycerate dehydrogenase n=1 Tax=hydrothermal vent metagenome TaxID=652676 RepID=A0A3B1B3U8_9ZZZZ